MGRRMKHTDIGDIPADWKLQTFEETFRVLSNNTLSRENLNNKGGAVRNIHYGDILTKFPEVLKCNEEDIPYLNDLSLITANTQLLQDGDVVIADTAEDDTVGKTIEVQNLGNGKLVAGLHTIPCRVKKGDFAPGWLGYYMNSNIYHDQIIPFITGIKVSSISKTAIAETIILIPPIEEQKRIIDTILKIDLLIKTEKIIADKILNIKAGCLTQMFPTGENMTPKMRFLGYSDNWNAYKLLDIADLTSSKRIHAEEYVNYGIPFYRGKEISELKENKPISETLYITEEKYKHISHLYGAPVIGDLLISAVGTLGNTWVVDKTPFYFKDGNLIWFKNIKCDSKFLDYAMSTQESQQKISDSAIGSNQKALTMVKLNELEFKIPNDTEQKRITNYLFNLDSLIISHKHKIEKYKSIKSGLISKLISTI